MMMAVSFEQYGRLYYVDPGPYMPAVGVKVLVPTDGGAEVAQCVWAPQWVDEDVAGLPVCAGLAGDEHLARDEVNRSRRGGAQGGGPAAGPRARSADEGHRRGLRRFAERFHGVFQCPRPR